MDYRFSREGGFSLVELVVATAVLAIGAVAIVIMFANISRLNRQARNLTVANQYAQQKIEEYRNSPYGAIATGTTDFTSSLPADLRSPRLGQVRVSDADPNADEPDPIRIKKVEVEIRYTDNSRNRHVQLTTLISERGINR